MASASDLDPDKLDALLPTGPVHSLRQVQAVYGALAEAASGGSTPPGQEEYSLYFTPSELEPFIASDEDEERFLVSVRVDFTGDSLSYEGIDVVPLSPDRVTPLGFARQSDGKAIDHSITRRGAKSGSDSSRITEYCIDCLERWTNGRDREPAVGKVADEHADGQLIHKLVDLGADESIQKQIKNDVEAKISGEPRVVATVVLRVDPADLVEPPVAEKQGWFYPGEIPVFNEAMRARKTWKYIAKNIDNGISEGKAACMVTGDDGRAVGGGPRPIRAIHAPAY